MPPLPGAPDALLLGDVLDLAIASAPSRLPLSIGALSSQLALTAEDARKDLRQKKMKASHCMKFCNQTCAPARPAGAATAKALVLLQRLARAARVAFDVVANGQILLESVRATQRRQRQR